MNRGYKPSHLWKKDHIEVEVLLFFLMFNSVQILLPFLSKILLKMTIDCILTFRLHNLATKSKYEKNI